MKTFSTRQVAELVGIEFGTLHRWLRAGKVKASQGVPMNGSGRTLWRWTDKDVSAAKKYKLENYRKGRGRKKK
jgi:predicted site-specific integrase-resolvase